jgi:hypothetical protein
MAADRRNTKPTTGRITARTIMASFDKPEFESVSSSVEAVASAV